MTSGRYSAHYVGETITRDGIRRPLLQVQTPEAERNCVQCGRLITVGEHMTFAAGKRAICVTCRPLPRHPA